MESSQGNFLLLGLVLLLEPICIIDGSVRPASVTEIHDVLLWGPHRVFRRQVEGGILHPPVLQDFTGRDEAWDWSDNEFLRFMKPDYAPGHLFSPSLPKLTPPTRVTSDHKDGEAASMRYVKSSGFPKRNSKSEFTHVESLPVAKKFTGKPTVSDGPKAQFSKPSKTGKFPANRKTIEPNQSTTTKGRRRKIGYDIISASSSPVLPGEFPDQFGRLPSNEEYDRNSRFSHSILYGFNTDF